VVDHKVLDLNLGYGCCVPLPTKANHMVRWPYICDLASSAGVQLRANEMEVIVTL